MEIPDARLKNKLDQATRQLDAKTKDRFPARFESLLAVAAVIGVHQDVEGVFSALATEFLRVVDFDFIGISKYQEETSRIHWHLSRREGDIEQGTIDTTKEETLSAWVYRHQKPLIIPCVNGDTRLHGKIRQLAEDGLRSVCVLPLTCFQQRIGCFLIGSKQAEAYPEDEVRFLSLIADMIASAVAGALNFEALQNARAELQSEKDRLQRALELNNQVIANLERKAMENALAYEQITELKNKLAREKLYLEDEIRSEKGFEEIIGHSAAIRAVLRNIETVAPTDSTVLICGETGTGKELVARAIHERSPRHAHSFVKLNCAAIPTGLLESELFGHERGAFTGAIMQRIGRFELANHGTAFLDEIAEISLELQPKLLRVLQEREFERLGSTRTLKTNARLIAATNRDLTECVEQQTFRADLFYRLNVFPIQVPPLRDRPEDIPLLVRHFAQHFSRRMNRVIDTIPSEIMEALVRHSWPGNIRELQNLVEHSVILSPGPALRVPLAGLHSGPAANHVAKRLTMEQAEREHILATLKETKWLVSGSRGAAARLGMNRSTLQFRMKRLGIVRPGS